MLSLLTAPQNLVFTSALGVVFLLFLVELFGLVVGTPASAALDGLFAPPGDAALSPGPDPGPGAGADLDTTAGALGKALAWLNVGRVPLLVLLVLFLLGFGLSGLALQRLLIGVMGAPAPGIVAALPALLAAVASLRVAVPILARFMPKDETDAVSRSSFVGRIAVITTGVARKGAPAEARLRDRLGRAHYVMVEPDVETDRFEAGSEVLLVSADRHLFRVIGNTSAGMRGGA